MSEVPNAGKKGYCIMYFAIILFFVIMLLVYLYRYNTNDIG
jgi:hypothetical protein